MGLTQWVGVPRSTVLVYGNIKATPLQGLEIIGAPVFFSSGSQRSSHFDVFNQMLPVMRNSIAGSVDGLCLDAIARRLMTFPEKAGILEGGNKFKHASRFLEHFALKIEVSSQVLFQFMDMLTELGTCDGVLQKLSKLCC